jgi:hypothetical protein
MAVTHLPMHLVGAAQPDLRSHQAAQSVIDWDLVM